MRWEDERYVRLYTRDTVAWRMLPWEGKALLPLILRKLDRAGLMPLEGHGAAGLAAIVELPLEVVEVGLAALEKDGCVRLVAGVLVSPNFIEAQEAAQSDAQRKRESRARARDLAAASRIVTGGHDSGQNVTSGHVESRPVTSGHSVPSLSVPSLSDPSPPISPSGGPADLLKLVGPDQGAKKKRKADQEPLPFTLAACCDELRKTGGVIVDPFPAEARFAVHMTRIVRSYPQLEDWRRVGAWLAAGGDGYGSGWRGGKPDLGTLLRQMGAWRQQAAAWDGRPVVRAANGHGRVIGMAARCGTDVPGDG